MRHTISAAMVALVLAGSMTVVRAQGTRSGSCDQWLAANRASMWNYYNSRRVGDRGVWAVGLAFTALMDNVRWSACRFGEVFGG